MSEHSLTVARSVYDDDVWFTWISHEKEHGKMSPVKELDIPSLAILASL